MNAPMNREPGQHFVGDLLGRLNWKSTKCLFIIGTGRVGSTTTIRLLNLSPHIAAFHEPKPLLRREAQTAFWDLEENESFYARVFARARRGPIGAIGRRKRIYAHFGAMTSFCPMIAKLLPKSHFLHLHRHPAEVIRSAMRRGAFQGHPWDDHRPKPSPIDPSRKSWEETWGPFEKLAWVWQAVNGYALNAKKGIPSDRFLSISSEQLFEPDAGAYRKIFNFLKVEVPPDDEVRQVLAVKHNAQRSGEFPAYSEWTDTQKRILREIAGPVMESLGYD